MPQCVTCSLPTVCSCKGSWRNIACSHAHYIEFIQKRQEVEGVPYKLRASDGILMWDIKDYVIKDETVDLITTMPDKTLDLFETEFLIVLNDEKPTLLNSYEDDGKYAQVDKKDYKEQIKFFGEAVKVTKKRKKKSE